MKELEKRNYIYINMNQGKFEPFYHIVNHAHPINNIDFCYTSMLLQSYNCTKRNLINLCEQFNYNYEIIKYGKEWDIIFNNLEDVKQICDFLNKYLIFTNGNCGLDRYSTESLLKCALSKIKNKNTEEVTYDKE